MDNLTHSLVGLAVAKSGFERLSPGATAVCIIAANAPDIDVFSGVFGDRWTALHYHRGITHSIVGTTILAIVIPLVFVVVERIVASLRKSTPQMRWRGLLIASLVASATHPLLDWTNNYGIRLLLPWSAKWSYGDLVFIVDPLIWLIFGITAFLTMRRARLQLSLWIVAAIVISSAMFYAAAIRGAIPHPVIFLFIWISVLAVAIGLYRMGPDERWRQRIAVTALAMLICYWVGLWLVHREAVAYAWEASTTLAAVDGEQVKRLAAMPTLADPTRWNCVAETDSAFYRFDLFLMRGSQPVGVKRFAKPESAESTAVAVAERDRRAQALIEFARFPYERIVDPSCLRRTLVQFADLRYTEPGASRGTFAVEVPIECQSKSPAANGR